MGARKGGSRFVSVCAAAILAACSSVHGCRSHRPIDERSGRAPKTRRRRRPRRYPPAAPAEPSSTSPEPQSPAAVPHPRAIPQPQPSDQRPHDSGIAMANCVPAATAQMAVETQAKGDSEQGTQGAPPPTASTVTETPPGTPVDAQVGELGSEVTSILGKKVQGPKGEDLGRVVDVLADGSGHVRVAIIDFGGFLGVGTRRIAVDWPLLRFDPNARDKNLILSLSREKLQSAPEYKDAKRPQVLMPPAASHRTPLRKRPTRRSKRMRATGDNERPANPSTGGRRRGPRPRLVQSVRRQHPDRLRPIHRGLSQQPELDADRDRSGAEHRHGEFDGEPGAGGRPGRCHRRTRRASPRSACWCSPPAH